MKKLFLLLLLLASVSAFSQTDTLLITQTERIIDKYTGKISNAFNEPLTDNADGNIEPSDFNEISFVNSGRRKT